MDLIREKDFNFFEKWAKNKNTEFLKDLTKVCYVVFTFISA